MKVTYFGIPYLKCSYCNDIQLMKHNNTFHAAREASPVSKDDEWQVFMVQVPDGLGCLVSRVRKPHLPRLGYRLSQKEASYYS